MRFIMVLIAALAAANAQTNQVVDPDTNAAVKIRITGDRVNLRASPDINGELLDSAMQGDEFVCLEKTNGWVAAQAPDSLDCWVSGTYVQNGIVKPEKLNVRSGPNLNYAVVAIVNKGDELNLRGEFNGWLKIAPPNGSKVWISTDYVEFIEPPKPEPITELLPEPENVVEPEPEPHLEPAAEPEPVVKMEEKTLPPLVLVMDKDKAQGQYTEIAGVLRRANPGLYKLVLISSGIEEPICLVRGKESQMERFLNRSMLIKGKMYWAKGVDMPVIQPEKIHLDPIVSD